MNTIARDQDTPEFQQLLKARQRVYSDATRYQILQLVLTVALPVAGAVSWRSRIRRPGPHVALYGLIATALDVTWMDRVQRRLLKVAAKISEEFDCRLLKMPWNSFVAGKREDAEIVGRRRSAVERRRIQRCRLVHRRRSDRAALNGSVGLAAADEPSIRTPPH